MSESVFCVLSVHTSIVRQYKSESDSSCSQQQLVAMLYHLQESQNIGTFPLQCKEHIVSSNKTVTVIFFAFSSVHCMYMVNTLKDIIFIPKSERDTCVSCCLSQYISAESNCILRWLGTSSTENICVNNNIE